MHLVNMQNAGWRIVAPAAKKIIGGDDVMICWFRIHLGCFRHAADTPPLEGLLILRCAVYDPLLEGSQIWKMKVAKMGVQDLIFAFVNILQMLSYVHQGGGGWGGVNVPDAYFTYVTAHVAVVNMLHMPSYIHQGRRGVLTLLTNISVTLRSTLPLLTCCTCRRIFIRGWGGVLTFLTNTLLTLRNTLPLSNVVVKMLHTPS